MTFAPTFTPFLRIRPLIRPQIPFLSQQDGICSQKHQLSRKYIISSAHLLQETHFSHTYVNGFPPKKDIFSPKYQASCTYLPFSNTNTTWHSSRGHLLPYTPYLLPKGPVLTPKMPHVLSKTRHSFPTMVHFSPTHMSFSPRNTTFHLDNWTFSSQNTAWQYQIGHLQQRRGQFLPKIPLFSHPWDIFSTLDDSSGKKY